jgi:serine phosphatase RsbU (regulator of sigma subunit)
MNIEDTAKEDLERENKNLRLELIQNQETLTELRKILDLYEHAQEMTRSELIVAKETISAHDNLLHLTSTERKEARHTMDAFKSIQNLSQEELLHKNNTLQKILTINNEITSIPKKEVLLSYLLDSILPVLKANRGILFLGKENHFSPKYLKNITKEEIFSQNFKLALNLIRKAIKQKRAVSLPKEGQILESQLYGYANAIICAPLKKGDEILGILYLDSTDLHASFSAQDAETLEIFTAQAAIAIQNSNLYYDLEKEVVIRTKKLSEAYDKIQYLYNEIENDLTIAKRIQDTLLKQHYLKPDSIDIHVEYSPMARIGGDFYDITRISDSRIRILLADATGHGIQAALITMLIKGIYDKLKIDMLAIDELLSRIGEEFYIYSKLNAFFSAIILDIDWVENKIYYSSAGHPEQVLVHEGEVIYLKSTGRMIGLLKSAQYRMEEMSFSPGDKIFLYTDGLTEEFNDKDQMFGDEKFTLLLEQNKNQSASSLTENLLTGLNSFMNGKKLDDDLAILSIEYLK